MTDAGANDTPTPRPLAEDDWSLLEPLLDTLLDADPRQRPALIVELSGGDAALERQLARLVAECERGYPLLDQPAASRFDAVFADDTVALPRTIASRYQLIREVGRGGMAIVYLARDLRHARDVAVKIVRPELAAALGRTRFLREVGIAARLRHPHIVPLYDSGEEPAPLAVAGEAGAPPPLLYYVMPYEAGHSLRERLAEGDALPLRDAVRIIRDIGEALAHAHHHGIVHRDIKPENVLLSDGHALITDFGVAHALNEATTEGAPGLAGMVVGTPAYMAPEQASNDPDIDHRADIYALGVLGYELLAASPPNDVPPALERVLARCVAPAAAQRWESAAELLGQLDTVENEIGSGTGGGGRRVTPRVIVAGVAVGTVVLLAATSLAVNAPSRDRAPGQSAIVLGNARQLTSEPGLEVQPSISPDGQHVAYAGGYTLETRIAVRPVAGGRAIGLAPDVAGNQWLPRWSPDGTRVLFLARDGVFSVPATGGPARMMVAGRPGAMVKSATWSPDGHEIAYVRGDSLLARSVNGGSERLVATGGDLHSCTWSPDGARLACVAGNSYHVTLGTAAGEGPMFANHAPSRIVTVPATGGTTTDVTDAGSLHQSPAWSPDGRLLYYVSSRNGPRDVYAIDIDARGSGEPTRITTGMGVQSIDFSANAGRIVYSVYSSTANVWAMAIRSGAQGAPADLVPVTSGNQTVEGVRVSPDGRWVIYDSDLSGNSDVYRVPVGGGEAERMTNDVRNEYRGAMSPDGSALVYHSFRGEWRSLFLMQLATGEVRQLTQPVVHRSMGNWSPDGNALSLFDIGRAEVFVMRRDRGGQWGQPRFIGRGLRPEWAPDGRSIAFIWPTDGGIGIAPSDSGTPRAVYRPGPGDPRAELAIYSTDGRDLYFKSHDATGRASFWSIPVAGGPPRLLARLDRPAHESSRFEFASDGRRFYFTFENRQSDVWVAEVNGR